MSTRGNLRNSPGSTSRKSARQPRYNSSMTIHLRSVRLKDELPQDRFPFHLPVIRAFPDLEFKTPVTFLVGENGSGKSTVLEALACAAGSITAGSEQASRDASLKDVRDLGDAMRLVWRARTRRGFFLRAEDFIGFVKRQSQIKADMQAEIREIDEGEDYRNRTEYAKGLAKMPYASQLHGMRSLYGAGLEFRSHGEQFLDFFQARFKEKGLYLLDEPEAPLSSAAPAWFSIRTQRDGCSGCAVCYRQSFADPDGLP